jgi:hypothetical protein
MLFFSFPGAYATCKQKIVYTSANIFAEVGGSVHWTSKIDADGQGANQ